MHKFSRYSPSAQKMISAQYLLYLPDGYKEPDNAHIRWPLILFLHGIVENGNDLRKVAAHGMPKQLEANLRIPFVIISPLNESINWNMDILGIVLDEALDEYRINDDRVYVTGLSNGGHGTWMMALAYPDRIAAIAPVCGWGDPKHVAEITHIPVWAFHGKNDTIVWPSMQKKVIDALNNADGNARWTIYPKYGHFIWNKVYSDLSLYEWFLQHKRATNTK